MLTEGLEIELLSIDIGRRCYDNVISNQRRQAMVCSSYPHPEAEDVRLEYMLAATYHNDMVKTRFTIAGFFIAAMGILLKNSTEGKVETSAIAINFLALVVSICVWTLEFRCRSLYWNLAHRCMDIERNYWRIDGKSWYEGLFSRLYKTKPYQAYSDAFGLKKPDNDSFQISWLNLKVEKGPAAYFTHSRAFDTLYGIFAIYWGLRLLTSLMPQAS